LAALPGDFRLRLSSIEATEVTRELIDVLADHGERVAPHLHISMQSGSDNVLRRMRRRWGSQRFVDRCGLLRDRLDRPAISSDVIVGFPGETEDDFQATCNACRQAGFSKIHIFPFSARRGTPAAEMPDQLPKPLKQDRGRRLAEVERHLRDAYFASLRGMKLQVLVESPLPEAPGRLIGTSCRYAPIELSAEQAQPGELVEVIAGEAVDGRIQGSTR
jgi:threonylcarbamoyladenosine tRNA methylthiotransferase MtaB